MGDLDSVVRLDDSYTRGRDSARNGHDSAQLGAALPATGETGRSNARRASRLRETAGSGRRSGSSPDRVTQLGQAHRPRVLAQHPGPGALSHLAALHRMAGELPSGTRRASPSEPNVRTSPAHIEAAGRTVGVPREVAATHAGQLDVAQLEIWRRTTRRVGEAQHDLGASQVVGVVAGRQRLAGATVPSAMRATVRRSRWPKVSPGRSPTEVQPLPRTWRSTPIRRSWAACLTPPRRRQYPRTRTARSGLTHDASGSDEGSNALRFEQRRHPHGVRRTSPPRSRRTS